MILFYNQLRIWTNLNFQLGNLPKFDSKISKFSSWVLNITKNHMIDVWRTSKEPTYSINNYSFGEQSSTANKLDNYFSTPSSAAISPITSFS